MKLFWALIGVLALGASAYLLMGRGERGAGGNLETVAAEGPVVALSSGPAGPGASKGPERPMAPAPKQGVPASSDWVQAAPEPGAAPKSHELTSDAPQTAAATEPARGQPPSDEAPKPAADASDAGHPLPSSPDNKPAGETKPAQPKPAAPAVPIAAPDPKAPGTTGSTSSTPSAPAPSGPAAPANAPAPSGAAPVAADTAAGPKIATRDDGSVLVDDRFILKGKGTKEEPYKVTWDQLLSAQDEYVPRDGRKKLPARITMLDGQYVELTGYVAFPVMADSDDECLSMMNQWDGCCIGVPPTPYDAVEVRLETPAKGNARLTTYGTISGKLKISPHLVGGWLVGLYVMDGGKLKAQSYGGFAP